MPTSTVELSVDSLRQENLFIPSPIGQNKFGFGLGSGSKGNQGNRRTAKFDKANLREANLFHTNLFAADICGADLTSALVQARRGLWCEDTSSYRRVFLGEVKL